MFDANASMRNVYPPWGWFDSERGGARRIDGAFLSASTVTGRGSGEESPPKTGVRRLRKTQGLVAALLRLYGLATAEKRTPRVETFHDARNRGISDNARAVKRGNHHLDATTGTEGSRCLRKRWNAAAKHHLDTTTGAEESRCVRKRWNAAA